MISHENPSLSRLRLSALIALVAGAASSLALMLLAGRRNDSHLLMVLMALWVLSPFVALVWADVVSKRWSVPTRKTLYSLILVVTLGNLTVYGVDALEPQRTQAAFFFVIVPVASWLLIAIGFTVAKIIFGRRLRRGDVA